MKRTKLNKRLSWLLWVAITAIVLLAFVLSVESVSATRNNNRQGLMALNLMQSLDIPPPPVAIKQVVEVDQLEKIKKFAASRNGWNEHDIELIHKNCQDISLTRRVIAISFAECNMQPSLCGKKANAWGWFAYGNRSYDPPKKEMFKVICNGVDKHYEGVERSRDLAIRYTGGDRVDHWLTNVGFALAAMQ